MNSLIAEKQHKPQHILVVDDEAAVLLMMQATLEGAGFVVETASSCQQARELFQKKMFDLILLDVLLPDGDGYQLCAEIRKYKASSNVPVAIVTGLDDLKSIHLAYDSGATDFITKPVAWGTLPYRVKYLLRSAQLMSDLVLSESKNRALLTSLPDIILSVNQSGFVSNLQAGANVKEVSGWYYQDEIHAAPKLPPAIFRLLAGNITQVLTEKIMLQTEFQWSLQEGDVRFWDARLVPQSDDEILMVVRDITQRKQFESELRLWAKVFESSNEAILITDSVFRIVSVNKAFEKMTGFVASEVLGVDALAVGTHLDGPLRYREIVNVLQHAGHWQGELINQRKQGEVFPCWFSISHVMDIEGNTENFVAIFNDITEYKNTRERIEFLAHHDILTKLPNRMLLHDRLELSLVQALRHHEKVGVLFIDLDRFKNINDSLGHAIGDQVLIETANRLTSALRAGDTVARLGGDEFVVMFPCVRDESNVADLTIMLRALLQAPYMINGMSLRITPSIGIAIYPEDGETGEELIKNADAAMYLAKEKGRNNYQFYMPFLNEKTLDRLTLENDLRLAIEAGEFELYYQPQIKADTGELWGVEALVRWRHSVRGLISPAEFIPLAEETGLIIPLGDWILAEAVAQITRWQAKGFAPFMVSVNISALQFRQTDFLWKLNSLLERAKLNSSALELELTETILMADTKNSIAMLEKLREQGYRIAIDDFGTGFSSLNYLRHFPINLLKIDQSFVRDLMVEKESTAIVESIITLAHALGKETIAEGVETEGQCEWLQGRGCQLLQGYFIARPMPVEQLENWVQTWDVRKLEILQPEPNLTYKGIN
ncbi:MAG: EAL domain-containing protein [Cellvibrio sp.]|nr:EAL domain-containing protein [Cellvibrio sp.]